MLKFEIILTCWFVVKIIPGNTKLELGYKKTPWVRFMQYGYKNLTKANNLISSNIKKMFYFLIFTSYLGKIIESFQKAQM